MTSIPSSQERPRIFSGDVLERASRGHLLEPNKFKYWAFISYSQKDHRWAEWLHRTLETYRIPKSLRGQTKPFGCIPNRLYPIFRDRDELASSSSLSDSIRGALIQSRHLIVICSPDSARSRWVNEEIGTFRSLYGTERVLCLIVSGQPNAKLSAAENDCFPPALHSFNSDREREEHWQLYPLAADIRLGNDSRRHAALRLIAGILGVGFEELRQRERHRTQRRILRNISIGAVAPLVYISLADDDFHVLGSTAIERTLDRYHMSLFRPVHSETDILHAAASARSQILVRLYSEWIAHTWLHANLTRTEGPKFAVPPWVSSQAMCAVFRTIDFQDDKTKDFLSALDAPFDRQLLITRNNKAFGWLPTADDYPHAEPALWTIAALAVAIGRSDLLTEDERKHFVARLRDTEQIAEIYQPLHDGGWNLFPQQDKQGDHSTYTTTLALLALLELHHSKLGWNGDQRRLDVMLQSTVAWLVADFDKEGEIGWRANTPDSGQIEDALTLQIYSELLRAEDEAEVNLPSYLVQEIPRRIDKLRGRTMNYPIGYAVIARDFTNFNKQHITRTAEVR